MTGNINVRFVFDSENEKNYVAIEGDVKKATKKEREELRDILVEACSQALGIESDADIQAETVGDFESIDTEVPDFVVDEIEQRMREKQAEENDFEKALLELSKKGKVTLDFPKKYADMTAYQVIATRKDEGVKSLQRLMPTLKENVGTYPKNRDKIAEIEAAIRDYDELKRSNIDPFTRALMSIESKGGEEAVFAFRKMLELADTPFEALKEKNDIGKLVEAYNEFEKVVL